MPETVECRFGLELKKSTAYKYLKTFNLGSLWELEPVVADMVMNPKHRETVYKMLIGYRELNAILKEHGTTVAEVVINLKARPNENPVHSIRQKETPRTLEDAWNAEFKE